MNLGFLRFLIVPVLIFIGKLATPSYNSSPNIPDKNFPKIITLEELKAKQDWQRLHPPVIESEPNGKVLPKNEQKKLLDQFIKPESDVTK